MSNAIMTQSLNSFASNNVPSNWSPSVQEDPRTKTVVYLSGKMAGVADNNFGQFNTYAKKWRENGWTLVNPAENFGGKQSLERNTYLKQDYTSLIQSCNAIALLPGWEDSVGARTELAIAQSLGYKVYEGTNPGIFMDVPVINPNPTKSQRPKLDNFPKEYVPNEQPKATKPEQESICVLADKIVTVDRQKNYGSPLEDFSRTAGMLTDLGFRFQKPHTTELRDIDPAHIPVIMISVKLSRMVNNENCFHRDSLIDIAGYAKCADMVETARNLS